MLVYVRYSEKCNSDTKYLIQEINRNKNIFYSELGLLIHSCLPLCISHSILYQKQISSIYTHLHLWVSDLFM